MAGGLVGTLTFGSLSDRYYLKKMAFFRGSLWDTLSKSFYKLHTYMHFFFQISG